jgi:hypothetical protein
VWFARPLGKRRTQIQLDLPLHKPMILLNDVVHILAGPALAFLRQQDVLFKISDNANVGGALVDIDYLWGGDIPITQDFAEEALYCSSNAFLIQEEIERLAG